MNWGFTFRYIKNLLAELNLFESIETRSNPNHLRNAIIATRLYIILITVTVFILVLFTTLGQQTQIVTIRNPSQDHFQELYSKHSPTLHCPCSQAEIPYEMFSNISYRFHPVCSSVFVSNSWINLVFRPDIGYFFPFDFRSSASGQFQLLASLCSFANKTVQDAVDCSCGTNAMCTSQASFDGLIVPGFYVGCYPLEALLQSTLECLYNITCIDQLQSMYIDSNITFNPLDATLSSSNMTVQSLVDVLFVEQWDTNMTYGQYYTACSPLWCTYIFDRQISPIYTVTTVISLYGGLSVTLKIITPILVRIGYYIITYRRRRLEIAVAVIN